MRRADRLFQIVQLMRRRPVATARWLAAELDVSERTIYRDIRDLSCSGVPIEGEAGVGFALPKSFDLPPLMFDQDEIAALVLGARIVQSWTDPQLAKAAESVLAKVRVVLPQRLRHLVDNEPLFAPNFHIPPQATAHLLPLRNAIENQRKLALHYTRADGQQSQRVVWPLALAYWGDRWTVAAWCEKRAAFRSFRLDRIAELDVLEHHFSAEPGRTLADYFAQVNDE